jgi:hypothetical protein
MTIPPVVSAINFEGQIMADHLASDDLLAAK